MLKKNFIILLLFIISIISSCYQDTPISSTVPSPSITDIKKGNLMLLVKDSQTNLPIKNAEITISNNQLKDQKVYTDSNGVILISDLPALDDYQILVNYDGYISRVINFKTLGFKVVAEQTVSINIDLTPAFLSLQGKVIDKTGNGIESVTVNTKDITTVTDREGNFKLNFSEKNTYILNFAKIRYKNKTETVNIGNGAVQNYFIILEENTELPKVLIDLSKYPLNKTKNELIELLNPLKSYLEQNKFAVEFNDKDISNLQNTDVLVILPPTRNYTSNEINNIKNFVHQGKKLIVLGEWGGSNTFNPYLNDIIYQFGLNLGLDCIREYNNYSLRPEYIIINNFSSHPILREISSLCFYFSSSVNIINNLNNTSIIARTSNKGLKIASIGEHGLIGVALYGLGKVVVIGDTSFWLNTDSNGDGTINFLEKDNKKLALNIFNW